MTDALTTAEAVVAVGATGADPHPSHSPAPSAPVAFHIPAPPSTNALFKNVRGKGRVKTRDYTDWLMTAIAAIRRQKVQKVEGRVNILVGVERHSVQADIDNRLKATLDALVKAEIIEDDNRVSFAGAFWMPPANHMAHVAIHPCQRMTLTFHPSHDGASGALVVDAPQSTKEQDDGIGPV